MSYSLDKDELTVMHTAGHALRAQVDANQSGIGRQRLAAPAGTTRHRLNFIPTLTRILENEEVKSAARKFVRQVGVTPAFWRDLLSSAASGPQDFMQAPKLTNRQQADVVSSVVDAAEKLQQALEYALVPVYPSVDEDKFFQEVSKLRSAYRSPRAPTLYSCLESSRRTKRAGTPPASLCSRDVSPVALTAILSRMIPALKREREALANRPDLMQLNKGEAPTRFILARLDIIIEQHFPEKSRAARVKPGPLVAALINAALELNSNTTLTLTPRRLADHRQYLRTKRG